MHRDKQSSVPFVRGLILGLILTFSGLGCAHIVESRSIGLFASALESENLEKLKSASSTNFQRRALRDENSLKDFKFVNVPTEKPSIVSVRDISDTKKEVVVEVGKSKQRLKYMLTRDAKSKKWVVDDIHMKKNRRGLTAAKTVGEQMELLLAVREFVSIWTNGSRERLINSTTPEFGETLSQLPPTYLVRLSERIFGAKKSADSTLRPTRVELGDQFAIVHLPRSAAQVMLSLKQLNGRWKVDEIGIESRDSKVKLPSVRRQVAVVAAATDFLQAYQDIDRTTLQTICTREFYQGTLSVADLSTVSLADPNTLRDDFEVVVIGDNAEFVITTDSEILKISLANSASDLVASQSVFKVDDVTIYELNSRQEKRLSALFLSTGIAEVFALALQKRDLKMLRHYSTIDFGNRVWNLVNESTIGQLPLREFDKSIERIDSTVFQGAVSYTTVFQGTRAVTYVLREQNGRMLVDDVEISITGRPASVKTVLEFMLPLINFTNAVRTLQSDRMGMEAYKQANEILRRGSSRDFNRTLATWHKSKRMPVRGIQIADYLKAPLASIRVETDHVSIVFGDGLWGAKVALTKTVSLTNESNRYLIDDIELIAGREARQRTKLKQLIREETSRTATLSKQDLEALNRVEVSAPGFTNTGALGPDLRHGRLTGSPLQLPADANESVTESVDLGPDPFSPISVPSPFPNSQYDGR